MDEDDHRRAEEEMNALSLRHLQHLQDSKKFVNRMTSMLYRALAIGIVVGLLSLLPPQLPSFVGHIRHAIFARTWDVVNVLLVAFAISYGVLSRGGRQETDGQIDGNSDLYDGRIFDYESVNRRRQHQYSNVVENSEREAVECSNLYEHEYAYEYPGAVAVPPMRRMRSSVSYQNLRALGRASDSNPRRAMDDTDWVRRSRCGSEDSKANRFQDSGLKSNAFGDSAEKSNGCEDSAIGLEDSAAKSSSYEVVSNSEDRQSPKQPEVKPPDFDFSAQIKNNVITKEDWTHPFSPPSPPPITSPIRNSNPAPPPLQRDSNPAPPPLQRDSNPAPPPLHRDSNPASPPPQKDLNPSPYQSEKRKKRPPSPPPPPPPRPPPALETHLPKQKIRDAPGSNPPHSYEKPEKPKKLDRIKSDKKTPKNHIPMPPTPPPLPTEILKHESRHRSSRSKDDSKQRSSEYKHSRSAKEIANALGLLPQSERKHKKNPIPSPPSPPPLPSTLQQWFSSYKRESKHKSKDSEPLPRHRSDKSRRKVHSASSPPPPPPPPPVPIYTIDPIYHKKRVSDKNDTPKFPIYSTDSNYQRNVAGSEKIDVPKPPIYTPDPQYQNNEISEKSDIPRKSSGKKDSSEYRKENVNGDAKAVEKLPERKSSSIPLPPPPPPPFPMVEHHWPFYDDPILQKRKGSSPENSAESERAPEPEPEPEPERGWAFVFRKQFSLDNADSQFCPSPSPDEVNQKADAFIARMHQQLRLQKSNSVQSRLR